MNKTVKNADEALAGLEDGMSMILNSAGISYKDSSGKGAAWAIMSKGTDKPVIKREAVTDDAMPQLAGLALKDAVYICETMGLRVQVKGKGKVAAQSLTAGQQVSKGQLVSIELN